MTPFRAATAFISTTPKKTAEPQMQGGGIVAGNPGTPLPMKKERREVPLPSQEGKQGVMQYALYVRNALICYMIAAYMETAPPWTKLQTGRAKDLSGP